MAVLLFLFSLGKNLDIFELGYSRTFQCAQCCHRFGLPNAISAILFILIFVRPTSRELCHILI